MPHQHSRPRRERSPGWLGGGFVTALLIVGLACAPPQAPANPPQPLTPTAATGDSTQTPEFASEETSELRLTYVANAGMLVEAGGRKVLFDGIASDNAPRYVETSAELRSDLLAAKPPFDNIDLVLATHRHADHFDAEAVATFLANSPQTTFVSTPGALRELTTELTKATDRADLGQRARAVLPATGIAEHLDDLGLTVLECHHGETRSPPIENLCFIAEVGPFTVLHVGDTEMTAADWRSSGFAEATKSSEGGETRVDLALLTSWQMPDGFDTAAVAETIKPRWIAAIHLVPRWPTRDRYPEDQWHRDWATRMAEEQPEIVVFRKELDARSLAAQ